MLALVCARPALESDVSTTRAMGYLSYMFYMECLRMRHSLLNYGTPSVTNIYVAM